jgi:hypothetical protein
VKDPTRLPSEAEIAEINARHLIRTPIKPADLLFVFGTREDVSMRPHGSGAKACFAGRSSAAA